MSVRSGGGRRAAPVGSRCTWILQRSLAITLTKQGLLSPDNKTKSQPEEPKESREPRTSFWMYDSGYLIFQSFLDANLKCFWNSSLLEAMRVLEFQGYVAPGVLLITANPCALEIVRAAWSRNVLKPPANYTISAVGDVEDCLVQPISQGQFTPLPEALCWVILDLTSSGQSAVLENIRATLRIAFPDMETPSSETVYDALAKLMTEKKVYQTSHGYFVVTPETRRLYYSHNQSRRGRRSRGMSGDEERSLLMSPDEALIRVLGDMETVRDGDLTHQAVQTNLADIICQGNPNDKVLYARKPTKRSQSLPPRKLERRHSLRIFGSSKRLASLHRSGSMKYIPTGAAVEVERPVPKRSTLSMLSRFFRRSSRIKQNTPPHFTFSAQFPPTEWFNKGVTHLHSVGTQTCSLSETQSDSYLGRSCRSFQSWDADDQALSQVSTLSRHRKRHDLSSSVVNTPHISRRAPHSATLPRRHISKLPSNNPSPAPSQISIPQTTASISSSKSVIETRGLSSPTGKSMSSSSSGYNSLPRSNASKNRLLNYKNQSNLDNSTRTKMTETSRNFTVPSESSITLKVSTSPNSPSTNGFINKSQPAINRNLSLKSMVDSSSSNDQNSTTLTTTVNGNNRTRIFVQQQNSPVRSLITLENGYPKKNGSEKSNHDNIIILNGGSSDCDGKSTTMRENRKPRGQNERPSSLYSKETNLDDFSVIEKPRFLETQLKMKYPSTETIQLEEKYLDSNKNNEVKQQNSNSIWKDTEMKINGLIDAMSLSSFSSETQLNNARKVSLPAKPFVPNDKDKLIESISYKNLLKNSLDCEQKLPLIKQTKNLSNPPSPTKSCNDLVNPNHFPVPSSGSVGNLINSTDSIYKSDYGKTDEFIFPSLSELSLNFTSLAAQNILNGTSLNSVDTLVEVNLAAEKLNKNIDGMHTDFGLV